MYGHTLLLDADWDLQLDAAGNIMTSSGDYAVAQNVANAIRLLLMTHTMTRTGAYRISR